MAGHIATEIVKSRARRFPKSIAHQEFAVRLRVAHGPEGFRPDRHWRMRSPWTGQMMLEAQKIGAIFAQQQLVSDVAAIEAYNKSIRERAQRTSRSGRSSTTPLLVRICGLDRQRRGRRWWVDQLGYAQFSRRPTATNQTDDRRRSCRSAYQPQTEPIRACSTASMTLVIHAVSAASRAGTAVRTIDGTRPIESLKRRRPRPHPEHRHRRPRLPPDPGRPPQPAQRHLPDQAGRRVDRQQPLPPLLDRRPGLGDGPRPQGGRPGA